MLPGEPRHVVVLLEHHGAQHALAAGALVPHAHLDALAEALLELLQVALVAVEPANPHADLVVDRDRPVPPGGLRDRVQGQTFDTAALAFFVPLFPGPLYLREIELVRNHAKQARPRAIGFGPVHGVDVARTSAGRAARLHRRIQPVGAAARHGVAILLIAAIGAIHARELARGQGRALRRRLAPVCHRRRQVKVILGLLSKAAHRSRRRVPQAGPSSKGGR
mmetsp:Transcript_17878/g.54722  ORF Transcript_17878/g.54722 Transcript_17878/m.54722 type:complete len:222 (-) Transcript_17878:211-876(-)